MEGYPVLTVTIDTQSAVLYLATGCHFLYWLSRSRYRKMLRVDQNPAPLIVLWPFFGPMFLGVQMFELTRWLILTPIHGVHRWWRNLK